MIDVSWAESAVRVEAVRCDWCFDTHSGFGLWRYDDTHSDPDACICTSCLTEAQT
jgi:hypothetical protein